MIEETYIGKPIIVDTNLLLLYLIGSFNKDLIRKHKRLSNYNEKDFIFVKNVIKKSPLIFTTPHILAEVSNIIDIDDPKFSRYFTKFVKMLTLLSEFYSRKEDLINDWIFETLGLTDSAIINAAKTNKLVILTDDREATSIIRAEFIDVINLTELKIQLYNKDPNFFN